MMMAEALSAFGFRVIGPHATVSEAMSSLIETHVDAAILDIRLGEELVYPLADYLSSKGVPFAFVTGYGTESLDPRFQATPVLQKPVDTKALGDLFAVRNSDAELAAGGLSAKAKAQRLAAS
jgi:hypothetical protein